MLSMAFGVALHTLVLAATPQDYSEAYQQQQETGRPLVVLVGADWCPNCVVMKGRVQRILDGRPRQGVHYSVLDCDKAPQTSRQILEGNSIPQLVMYRRIRGRWERTRLVGARSPEEVASFLKEAEKGEPKSDSASLNEAVETLLARLPKG